MTVIAFPGVRLQDHYRPTSSPGPGNALASDLDDDWLGVGPTTKRRIANLNRYSAAMGRDLRFNLETTDEGQPYVSIHAHIGTVFLMVPNTEARVWQMMGVSQGSYPIAPRDTLVALLDDAGIYLGLSPSAAQRHAQAQTGVIPAAIRVLLLLTALVAGEAGDTLSYAAPPRARVVAVQMSDDDDDHREDRHGAIQAAA